MNSSHLNLHRRNWLTTIAAGAIGGMTPSAIHAGLHGKPPWPLYVMDTGLRGSDVPDWDTRAKLAKDLGFSGIGVTLDHATLGKTIEILDRNQLEVTALYTVPGIEDVWDEKWNQVLKRLKGRPTRIELALVSRKGLKPSDPSGDDVAVKLIRKLIDGLAEKGPVLSIYPHRGSWTEKTSDGVRLAKKINDPRFGTHFNLIHTRWVEPDRSIESILKEAKPWLQAVTVNGISRGQIVSLDQGDEDLPSLLEILKKMDYRGIIGLQGYGIPGKSADHLGRSMAFWQKMI